MSTVLVTGANGFIGQHLIKELHKTHTKIIALYGATVNPSLIKEWSTLPVSPIQCDLIYETSKFKSIMESIRPNIVFHLAGCANPRLGHAILFDSNITATNNILPYIPSYCKLVFASSITVYGNFLSNITDEYSPCVPTNFYAATKLACEDLIACTLSNYAIARICATVGPNMTHGVVFDILRKLKSNSEYLELFGQECGSIKSYIHINDVVSALIDLSNIEQTKTQHFCKKLVNTFNITTNDTISIYAIAYTIMNRLHLYKDIKWVQNETNGDNHYVAASNKKMLEYGWKPKYTKSKDVICTIL